MKILLIDPVVRPGSVPLEARRRIRRGIGYLGLGLCTVAALTPDDMDVQVVDEAVEDLDLDDRPDLVGIAVLAPTAPHAYRLAAHYRRAGVPVVLGGIHVSLNPDEAMPHADAVVVGEAELTWPQLIEDFRRNALQRIYRADGLADFRSSPLPRRDLLRSSLYRLPGVVQTSKGCPHGCEFCSLPPVVGLKPRYRRVEDVIDEIRRMPARTICFADENLYSNRSFTAELLRRMIPLNRHWIAETTWHIARDDEVLSLARQSGCMGLYVGFDSVNQQHHIRKLPAAGDVERTYIQAIRNIQGQGIAVMAGFVFGLDSDDVGVFERSLRVILEGRADLANFNVALPYPGTPLFDRLKTEGRITEWDWSKYLNPHVCFEPKRMSAEQLRDGIAWAWSELYSAPNMVRTAISTVLKLGWATGLITLRANLTLKRDCRLEAARLRR